MADAQKRILTVTTVEWRLKLPTDWIETGKVHAFIRQELGDEADRMGQIVTIDSDGDYMTFSYEKDRDFKNA